MLRAQSTTKDYIRAEHKLNSIFKLVIPQVIIPQSHVFFVVVVFFWGVAYLYPRALNTGTCIKQGDLFYSADLHRNHVLATANTGKNRGTFWKKCREYGEFSGEFME